MYLISNYALDLKAKLCFSLSSVVTLGINTSHDPVVLHPSSLSCLLRSSENERYCSDQIHTRSMSNNDWDPADIVITAENLKEMKALLSTGLGEVRKAPSSTKLKKLEDLQDKIQAFEHTEGVEPVQPQAASASVASKKRKAGTESQEIHLSDWDLETTVVTAENLEEMKQRLQTGIAEIKAISRTSQPAKALTKLEGLQKKIDEFTGKKVRRS